MQERGGSEDWVNRPNARVAALDPDTSSSTMANAIASEAARYMDSSAVSTTSRTDHDRIQKASPASPIQEGSGNWNTKALGFRIGADLASAACAGVLVAPIITIIDKGIIENATGSRTLGASIKDSLKTMLLRPHNFFLSRPFGLIFALYTGTYMMANTVDTVSSVTNNDSASHITHGTAKFAAVSVTNLSLCLWKDTHFTRLFSSASPRAVPPITYGLFAARDCMTIFASFNLPPILGPKIPMHIMPEVMRGFDRQKIAQFVTPAAVQIFSTPLHLLGLDFYNRNGTTTVRQRWDMVRKAWAMSCLARIGRIVPAFGVGGVVNTSVRKNMMHRLE